MRRLLMCLAVTSALSACGGAEPRWSPDEAVSAARYVHAGPPAITLFTVVNNRSGSGAHSGLLINGSQRVIFDPAVISYEQLLTVFWENHDPTQGLRQGNDVGSTYRSGIYTYGADQQAAALASKAVYADRLRAAGHGAITTEIMPAPTFYYAEDHHQQYLAKNPEGYCGLRGTGVSCPIGLNA
mgnify:CR=1 FL=1